MTQASFSYPIYALVVTYGDRWEYLEQVLFQLENDVWIKGVILINNATSYNLDEAVQKANFSKTTILDMGENTGSAFAIKQGLLHIESLNDNAFVWLLDDDNLPKDDATLVLTQHWNAHAKRQTYHIDRTMLVSIRENREYLVLAAKGHLVWKRNAFFGFHALSFLDKRLFKHKQKAQQRPYQERATLPFAPYGGMFFHVSLLKKIGYPNPDFYIYASDYDFSVRVPRAGGEIWLIPKSQLVEVDAHWSTKAEDNQPTVSHVLATSPFRIYYMVRNSVYFWKKYLVNNPLLFHLNRFILTWQYKQAAKKYGLHDNFKLFKKAVKEGLRGELGKREF